MAILARALLKGRKMHPNRPMGAPGSSQDKSSPSGEKTSRPVAGRSLGLFYGGFKVGHLANNKRMAGLQCSSPMAAQIFRMALMSAPLHEEAVADAPEQTGHKHGVRVANSATVVILGDVQTLVEAVFDAAKTRPIQLQPLLGIEFLRWGAGEQANVFLLATFGLAQPVSKAICLLQFVKSIHRTPENIAATLHPVTDADSRVSEVRQALEALEKAGQIRKVDDGYRIPTPAEDDWERQRSAVSPKPGDVNMIHAELAKELWQPQPAHKLLATKTFKAGLTFNNRLQLEGDIPFHISFADPGSTVQFGPNSSKCSHVIPPVIHSSTNLFLAARGSFVL